MLMNLGADQDVIKRLLDAAEQSTGQPVRLNAPNSGKILKVMEELWRQYRQVILNASYKEATSIQHDIYSIANGFRALCEEAKDQGDIIAGYVKNRLQKFVTSLIEWAIEQIPSELKVGSQSMVIVGIKLMNENKVGANLNVALFQVATLVNEGTLKLEVSYGGKPSAESGAPRGS